MMTAGMKTSEFWGIIFAASLTILNSWFGLGINEDAILQVNSLAGVYALVRSYAKSKL